MAEGDRVKLVSGDNYFEVFDLSVVSEVIPDLRVAYGVDESMRYLRTLNPSS